MKRLCVPFPHPAASRPRRAALLIAGLAFSLLTGCASVYRVDSQVQSFARWTDAAAPAATTNAIPQAPQLYRFERLPSQAADNAARGQTDLETITRTALAKHGWTPAEPGGKRLGTVSATAVVSAVSVGLAVWACQAATTWSPAAAR